MSDIKIGETVKAGTYLLFTRGVYSDFGINGLYRAKCDFIVPAKLTSTGKPETDYGSPVVDIYAISINVEWVEEVEYVELWGGS